MLLQWTAEADMRDFCFICGVNSYKFESRSYVRTRSQLSAVLVYLFFFSSETNWQWNFSQKEKWIWLWKNFENPFTFAKVMIKNQVSCFFETQCRISSYGGYKDAVIRM